MVDRIDQGYFLLNLNMPKNSQFHNSTILTVPANRSPTLQTAHFPCPIRPFNDHECPRLFLRWGSKKNVYSPFKQFKYQFLILIICHYLMLDWDYGSEKSLPFLANTDESSLCAPLQHPLDTEELPPELTLDQSGWPGKEGWGVAPVSARRRSIDQPFSILGFIERRISDRRGRVNSEELNKRTTQHF